LRFAGRAGEDPYRLGDGRQVDALLEEERGTDESAYRLARDHADGGDGSLGGALDGVEAEDRAGGYVDGRARLCRTVDEVPVREQRARAEGDERAAARDDGLGDLPELRRCALDDEIRALGDLARVDDVGIGADRGEVLACPVRPTRADGREVVAGDVPDTAREDASDRAEARDAHLGGSARGAGSGGVLGGHVCPLGWSEPGPHHPGSVDRIPDTAHRARDLHEVVVGRGAGPGAVAVAAPSWFMDTIGAPNASA
jgi:hypothetical protein